MIPNRFIIASFFSSALSLLSSAASADEAKNYFSLKYGLAQSNMPFNNEAKFKNDEGSVKDVEFFWGNATLAKWIGGVKITP